MKSVVNLTALLFLLSIQYAFAKKEGALSAGMVNPGYEEQPDWFKNSFLDLSDDIEEAAASGKRLMVFFYQDGCPYCKKLLQDNLGQRDIAEKTRKNFDVVSLNIWGDREVSFAGKVLTEKNFAALLKVMYTPTLLFFNEQGKLILRINGYYYPAKFSAALDYARDFGRDSGKQVSFREYLVRVSPLKSSGEINKTLQTMTSPYDFSAKTGRYRLLMFEQKQCRECDELHNDVLNREKSKQQLKKFDIAVLDMWSKDKITRPDGKQSSIKDWAKSLNIQYAPSLVYLDPEGKEVFRSDAYLKSFHIQSVMDYVSSGAYKKEAHFQRYIDQRAERLRKQGEVIDLMQ
ncbi:thioredoxin SoxW [hydrothermal vent metagenome]|uniref:Thioredoxin SoxW n=1 Tax=hydrothermal vent metagenome TaxID=652676 RepID=A0A3B0XYR4_9ZZZZ